MDSLIYSLVHSLIYLLIPQLFTLSLICSFIEATLLLGQKA